MVYILNSGWRDLILINRSINTNVNANSAFCKLIYWPMYGCRKRFLSIIPYSSKLYVIYLMENW